MFESDAVDPYYQAPELDDVIAVPCSIGSSTEGLEHRVAIPPPTRWKTIGWSELGVVNVLVVCCDCCSGFVILAFLHLACNSKETVVMGDLVQASPCHASRLESCSMFLQCMFSFL